MSFDYEYIPTNSGEDDEEWGDEPPLDVEDFHHRRLPSSYDSDAPPGLRGEAVRSALKSGRCITWQPHETGGALCIRGKGTLDFLNNKLSKPAPESAFEKQCGGIVSVGSFYEACLLTSSGRVVDRLKIAVTSEDTAIVLTSPGHSGQDLLKRLDPYIFPMDQVSLSLLEKPSTSILVIASTKWDHVQSAMKTQVIPKVMECLSENSVIQDSFLMYPEKSDECFQWCDLETVDGELVNVLIMASTGLPTVACAGYTLVFYPSFGAPTSSKPFSLGSRMWEHLIDESNAEGPIHVGASEYETLRIEAGVPAYDCEIGGGDNDTVDKRKMAGPLEISQNWFDETVRPDRGCYLGQEAVAAMRNNKRGAPRTLYRVMFDDDANMYESETRGGYQSRANYLENITRPPKPGDKLCVLGSNEKIEVGTITSVAEPDGTGDKMVVGLALIKRSDSIFRKLDAMNLERPKWGQMDDFDEDEDDDDRPGALSTTFGSGIIMPPPLDPLDNLEVVIKGTYTIGRLSMIPVRAIKKGANMFDENVVFLDLKNDALIGPDGLENTKRTSADSFEASEEIAANAPPVETKNTEGEVIDEAAVQAEAERKAAKMKALQDRAAEAMARRKAKAAELKAQTDASKPSPNDDVDAAAAEEKRKEEKMKLLKQRAEEALARRRQKKSDADQ